MKILIDCRSINLHSGTGIGTYTRNLVHNLINMNKKDIFNLIWTGSIDNNYNKSNTNISLISAKYSSFYDEYFIPNLIESNNEDLYHIPQNGLGFPLSNKLNVVVTIHDLIPYIMPETVGSSYLNKFIHDMPDIVASSKGIFTVSEYSKKDILRFFPKYPAEKIYVTPLAAAPNFKPISKELCKSYIKQYYKITDPFILYVGGFSSRKNVKSLILSYFKIFSSFKRPHKLVLAGAIKDSAKELIDLVMTMGMGNYIIFPGYVDDNILPIFYNAAETFVYPSLYEGFGLPPLEAMSCKTPVITSNTTSIPEVTGDCSLLIDPNDVESLSTSLLKLLNSNDLKEELSKKGYKRSLQFSWRQTAKKTFEAYKKIILTS